MKAHFDMLQTLQKSRELILAGRTFPVDPEGFGIVILDYNTEKFWPEAPYVAPEFSGAISPPR